MKTCSILLTMGRLLALLGLACCGGLRAAPLPPAAELQRALAGPPQDISVVEPHLSVAGAQVRRSYRGYPAERVLRLLLGPDWDQQAQREIEFKALDGFIARVPVQRFLRHRAYLVFARSDGQAFSVDNLAQQQKDVALGPYYLVWDNIGRPALLAEGGAVWPYQVAEISLREIDPAALLPAGTDSLRWAPQAALAQKYCLSCHQINGFGGAKMPLNLAVRAKLMDSRTWQGWLLQPQALKPGTAMPALPDSLPAAERLAIARQLHDYLKALPVAP